MVCIIIQKAGDGSWRYLEPGAQYNGHVNGREGIMAFGNESGNGGMVKNVSMFVVGF
jgi:hypothetical protein